MRCLGCCAEMQLIEVIKDARMAVIGFERHISRCSGCSRLKWRWEVAADKAVPIETSPTVPRELPMPATQSVDATPSVDGGGARQNAWTAAIETLRTTRAALEQRAVRARYDGRANIRPLHVAAHAQGARTRRRSN